MKARNKPKNKNQVRVWIHPSLNRELEIYKNKMQDTKRKRYTKIDASKRVADLIRTLRNKNI